MEEKIDLLLQIQHRQMVALERIASILEQATPVKVPNYQRSLSEFATFDWESIGATVEKTDQYGAGIVVWRGYQFVRRSPSNKFDEAIWFSRCVGKDESGGNSYERLITFKALSRKVVEPIPDKVQRLMH